MPKLRRDEATRRRRPVWSPLPRWYVRSLRAYEYGDTRALWFAVLDNAIQALRGKLRIAGKSPSRAYLAREARRWLSSDAQEPLGTFASICRELDLDRATVRADLLAIEYVGQTPRPRAAHLRFVHGRAA